MLVKSGWNDDTDSPVARGRGARRHVLRSRHERPEHYLSQHTYAIERMREPACAAAEVQFQTKTRHLASLVTHGGISCTPYVRNCATRTGDANYDGPRCSAQPCCWSQHGAAAFLPCWLNVHQSCCRLVQPAVIFWCLKLTCNKISLLVLS